ncbi:MAG: ADP-dependent glucokinase/phosphofructokinase [Eubacteriales bacterium]|nr:ADP-dependent glucokinase/phosphofructokinase [Eubacteriales bacterium]
MGYQDRYQEYLEEVSGDIAYCIESGKRPVFGYTSDLDVVFQYDPKVIDQLIAEHLTEEPKLRTEDLITSLSDLARVIAGYMMEGAGGEIDITDYEVCTYLNEHFEGTPGLGGTCAQGAAALAATGMPLLAHITDRCKEVCTLLDYPGLEGVRDGRAVPIRELATEETPVYHMILQYSKGDVFHIGDKEYTVPCSNRLIMDYDTIHKDLNVDADFRKYLEEHAEDLISYNISGMNGIVDAELVKRRMEEMSEHYRRIREKNPGCIFYFESAHYLSQQVMQEVYSSMAGYVDIMGMNEEELAVYAGESTGQALNKGSLDDILRCLQRVKEQYGAKGIILHTKDYSLYYGKKLEGIDIEKGLTIGNLMSGTRARVGRYGTREECAESLSLSLSEKGLRFAEELSQKALSEYTCLVPSRYMEKPKYTIGLGDTFVAGVQMAFVSEKK